jgi:predicted nucleotidyltransferase
MRGDRLEHAPSPGTTSVELRELASIHAEWADSPPGIPAVYLFGSRVRGDHRPGIDVDVRLYLDEWRGDEETLRWWMRQNETDFAALKAQLPGPLAIHREPSDNPDPAIRAGMKTPVLIILKVICVWTPPIR